MNEAGILRVRGFCHACYRIAGYSFPSECNEIDAGNGMDDCLETRMIEKRNNKFDGNFSLSDVSLSGNG